MRSSSSTAIEARAMSVPGLPLEDELRRPDGDRVAGAQLRPLEAAPVDLGAVGGVEVDDPVSGARLPDLGMAARNVRVGDLDVAVLRAPDHDPALLDLVLLAVPREGQHPVPEPAAPRASASGQQQPRIPSLASTSKSSA